jgi:hypothetical protein
MSIYTLPLTVFSVLKSLVSLTVRGLSLAWDRAPGAIQSARDRMAVRQSHR